MINSILQLQGLLPKEKLAIKLFFVSVLTGIIITFLATVSGRIAVLTVLASVITGYAGIIIYIQHYSINKYTKWLLFLLLYFLAIGISYGDFNPSYRMGGNFMWIVTQDLRYVMYFIIGSIFATKRYMPYFHKVMKFLGYSSIVAAIFGLFSFDFNFQHINDREIVTNFSYYCWWISTACFSYWGYYAIIVKKEEKLGYGVLLSYFILGILFLKRSAFINVIALLLIANFISNKVFIVSFIKILLLTISLFIITFFLINILHIKELQNIFTSLFNRFENIDEVSSIDRVIEWKSYFEESSLYQKLLGNGIGHYPVVQINKNVSLERANAMHIGFYNIIFKGGIIYALFYIFLYFSIFLKSFKLKSFERNELVYFGVAISSIISMFYEGSWTYGIDPFCISAPILYIALKRNHENKYQRKVNQT